MIELLYYVTVKSIINRIRKYPFMILGITLCFLVVMMIPLFYLNTGYSIKIPSSILNAFFSLYFAFCLFEIAREKNSLKTMPINIEMLVIQVPENTKKIFECLVGDTAIKSIASYGIVFICVKLYTDCTLVNVLFSLLLLIVNVTALVFLSSIIDLLSLRKKSVTIKILVGIFGVLLSINAFLELFGIRVFGTLLDNILPPYIYAGTVLFILDNKAMDFIVLISGTIFLLIMVIGYLICLRFIKIKASDILMYCQLSSKRMKYVSTSTIEKVIKVLPQKMRLLCAKEIAQIISEKNVLMNVFIQTFIAASIMIVSAVTIEPEAMRIGIFVTLAYMSFILALYSIPRETNTVWIYKMTGINKYQFAMSKFFVNFFVSVLFSVIILMVYIFIVVVITRTGITYISTIIQGYLWSLITILPLATIWGIVIGALLPYKVIAKKKKITYKFNGVEGLLLTILIFVAVIPAYLISQLSGYLFFDLIYLLYLFLLFIGMLYFAGKAYTKMV